MRIVELTYSWPAETFIQRHVLALREAGLDVRLVARQGTTFQRSWASIGEEDDRIPALVMPNFDHLDWPGKLWSLRHLLLRPWRIAEALAPRDRVLLAFFERLRPDLIHFHTASLAALMRWIPQALGIPYTVSLRGSDVQVFPLRSEEAAQETGAALRGAAGVHTVCDALGRLGDRWAGGPLERQTIYTTVPVPLAPLAYGPDGPEDLHLVAVGRLHWHKAIPDLLVAVQTLKMRGVKTHLTVVGSGPDEARLRFWVARLSLQNEVTLFGKLPLGDVQKVLSHAHAFVQPSVAEGFSNAMAEAMAWGYPVFATNVGGTAEVVRDGENGFLLPALQPGTWPERLTLARDRALMERVRRAAYETARYLFDPLRHAEAFLAFYRQALRRGPVPVRSEPAVPPHAGPAPADVSPMGPRLLVRGAWCWENGPDLILRALAPLCREGRLQVVFWGHGPQEDELRYLVDFLGLAGQVRLVVGEPEPERQAPGWAREACAMLDIAEAQERGWQLIRDEVHVESVPFADGDGLKRALLSMVGERISA
ncbi:MAG: glycosyltransferase [Anaerolineae bacterium]